MGARLAQIEEQWHSGGLQKAGLESTEVALLVSLAGTCKCCLARPLA